MNNEELNNLRHSAAHLLAAAVLDLYPGTHNAIGPAIENGFYQDFDFGDVKISDDDLPKIEEKMRDILSTWDTFEITEVPVDQAEKDFAHNPYKSELIEEFSQEGKTITETRQGNFLDLCKGGHLEHPKDKLKHFKLLSIAGAYWRGNEKNKMLTRIYGTAFPTKDELEGHLTMLEEAKKRDHKRIGREQELFLFEETAPGEAYWLPKGLIIYNTLYDFTRSMYHKYGYTEVATPILNKKALYETSGHWTHYKDDMFIANMGENEEYGVKPMNCPNAMTIFGYRTRSYTELPLRLADTSLLHRYELSGTLNGLFRIRAFRQDDAHIFISAELIKSEFENLMAMVSEMYQPFGLSYRLRFGTRPEKFLGEKKDWDFAEESLKSVLDASGQDYITVEGEGAFYGPKVDILMKDSLGREWQTGTIQLDLQQPKRFGLEFIDTNGEAKMPFVYHRAIYGSLERFLGILTEHYAGAFPLWLSPVQVELLPIADRHVAFAEEVATKLREKGIRVEVNAKHGTLQGKIRDAALQKVPYLGIIGDKEIAVNAVSVRVRGGNDQGQVPVSDFLQRVEQEIDKKE